MGDLLFSVVLGKLLDGVYVGCGLEEWLVGVGKWRFYNLMILLNELLEVRVLGMEERVRREVMDCVVVCYERGWMLKCLY